MKFTTEEVSLGKANEEQVQAENRLGAEKNEEKCENHSTWESQLVDERMFETWIRNRNNKD